MVYKATIWQSYRCKHAEAEASSLGAAKKKFEKMGEVVGIYQTEPEYVSLYAA